MPQRTRTSLRTPNAPASVEAFAIDPEEPPKLVDGKLLRPSGPAPVEGYVWNNVRGSWVPGQYLLQTLEMQSKAARSSVRQRAPKRNNRKKTTNRATQKRKLLGSTDVPKLPMITAAMLEASNHDGDDASDVSAGDDDEEYEDDEASTKKPSSDPVIQPQQDWYHPHSRWEEPIPTADETFLTLYEKHRTPRQVPAGTITGVCSVASVQQEVRCGICLECVVRTRIVRECRHRFCEPCVEKALSQAKECPICRTPIPSRRSLEPDLKFDALLQSVIGKHLRSDERVNLDESVKPSVLQQALNKKREALEAQFATDSKPADSQVEDEYSGDTDEARGNDREEETPALIKLVLRREVTDEGTSLVDSLSMPYLRIAGDAPVLVLKNFLRKKHRSRKQFSIWSILGGGPEVLSDMTRLQFVASHLTDDFEGDYMPLYYREMKISAI